MNFANVTAAITSHAVADHLRANGWDGVIYNGEVTIRKIKYAAILYKNAKTGCFEIVAKVKS